MDAFKQAWERIRGLYARLSPSQQLTLGILAFVVAAAVWTLVTLSGTDTLAPLTRGDGTTPPEVIARVQDELERQKIRYENRGGVLYVPYAQRDKLMWQLQKEGGPLAEADPFKWVHETMITVTRGQLNQRWIATTQAELQRRLRQMEAVQNANVMLTLPPDAQTMPLVQQYPTASVILQLKTGKTLDRGHVMAIASYVSHAVPSLEPHRVAIVDTQGKKYGVPGPGKDFAEQQILADLEEERAKVLKEKILAVLGHIQPPPQIALTVELESQTVNIVEHQVLSDNTAPVHERSARSQATGATNARPPGGSSTLAPAVLSTASITQSEEGSSRDVVSQTGSRDIRTEAPPGARKNLSCTVILPKQWVDAHHENPDNFKSPIARAIGLMELSHLEVIAQPFPQIEPMPEPPTASVAWQFLTEHATTLAMALLILIALVMIYGIIQRAIPRDIAEQIERIKAQLEAQTREEALAAESPVDAQMVQMKTTVKSLVQKSPRTVATILRRWMMRT